MNEKEKRFRSKYFYSVRRTVLPKDDSTLNSQQHKLLNGLGKVIIKKNRNIGKEPGK